MYTPLSVVGEGEDLVEIKVLEPLVKEQYRSHRDVQEAIYKPKRVIHHIEEWSRLDISYNGLRIISPSIAQFSQLTELYLNHNALSLLPVELFTVLLSLRRLDLSYNQIMWIPPDISNLLQLQVLSLVHNQIRELPVEMGKLFRLEKLEIDGNPIISPPIDVLQQDAMFITSFLREKMPTGEPPPPREWQYNTALSNADMKATLRVMCYNILADSYTGPATVYCPRWAVHWDYRKQRLLNELNQCNADVICLQEVENESFTTYFEPEMERLGYLGVFRPKSRARTKEDVRRVDGCAIFFKSELFDLLDLQLIEFQQLAMHKYEQLTGKKTNNSHDSGLNRLMTKDNIALVVLLRVKSRARARLPHDRVMVVTTHIHWDPEYCDVKLMQTQLMLEQLEELNARYLAQINKERGKQSQGWLPMLLCGDFNSMPDSGVYQLLHTGHVDNNHQDFVDYQYGSYTASNGTGLNHNIPLRSSYAQVGGEPPFTNFTSEFVGVLDYIWYTPHAFTPLRVLKGVDPSTVLSSYGALPNPFMCSDHIPLLVEVLFASPQGGFAASPQKFKH